MKHSPPIITTLVAAHEENPYELVSALRSARGHGLVVLASPGDPRPTFVPHTCWREGAYATERAKRNALLELGKALYPATDWFLSVDADEILVGAEQLPRLLERWPASLPAYPLFRQEPDGETWALPCKLFRADVERYEWLDLFVRWHGEVWNLDAVSLGRGLVLPTRPTLMHYPSPRAAARSSWYTEPEPAPLSESRRITYGVGDGVAPLTGFVRL